jgi:hypothetical protein
MTRKDRTRTSRRVVASTVLGAALAAGVIAGGMPATAAQPATPADHSHPGTKLPKVGARKTPFSPRTATSATTAKGVTAADAADHPWLVGIMVNNGIGTAMTCTGTIISPTKVLTSARCDTEWTSTNVAVIAGRNNLLDDTVGFVDGVASTWTDPNFTPDADGSGMGSNVQVLTLTQPMPSVYTPISLSAQGDESPYSIGGSATTYGYQWTDNQNSPNYPYLVQSPVIFQGPSGCQAVNAHYPQAEESCAGFADGAQHDSIAFNVGSPLIGADGRQIGVADLLTDEASTLTAFEHMSVFHDSITADLSRPVPNNADWTGDGNSDVFGEDFNGNLTVYQGYGANPALNPGFTQQEPMDRGYDWNTLNYKLMRVNDFDGTGDRGLLTVRNDGTLVYYPSDPSGFVDPNNGQSVGTGWDQFSNIIAINNFTGDGNLALIGEEPDGELFLYEHGKNGWIDNNGREIGGGFNQFTALMSFQWTNDGHVGLLGITPNGDLRFYGVDGNGNWTNGNGLAIGGGFAGFIKEFSVGSFGGSDTGSFMTVDQYGILRVYQANGTGGWLTGNGVRIGVGFQTMETLF